MTQPLDPGLTDVTDRLDAAEETAAATTERRDAEHVAQAETNDAQTETNADQKVVNASAVAALLEVATATKALSALVEQNVTRNRRWTVLLGVVLAVVTTLGFIGFNQLQVARRDGADQRRAIRAQARRFCEASAQRDASFKTELGFLVTFAIGDSTNPRYIEFLADYPAHLNRAIPPITDC